MTFLSIASKILNPLPKEVQSCYRSQHQFLSSRLTFEAFRVQSSLPPRQDPLDLYSISSGSTIRRRFSLLEKNLTGPTYRSLFPVFSNLQQISPFQVYRSYSTTSKTSVEPFEEIDMSFQGSLRMISEKIPIVRQNIHHIQALDKDPRLCRSKSNLEYTTTQILDVNEWIFQEVRKGTFAPDSFMRSHFDQLRNMHYWWWAGVKDLKLKEIILSNEQTDILENVDFLLKNIHHFADIFYNSPLHPNIPAKSP